MHFRVVVKTLGLIAALIGATFVFSLPWAFADLQSERRALAGLVGAMAVSFVVGGAALIATRGTREEFLRKEGIAVVGLGWLLCAGLGALPYIFAGVLGPIDALFESMSGFTTTGATVLTDIESVPRSLLFWRSFTHFLGGMGILVLFIAVLPYLGVGGKQLFKTEAPGLKTEGLKPRIQETAKTLWTIYILLTAIQCILLWLSPKMDLFEALCHTFGTMATGGFSTRNLSIESYNSLYIETVIIVFMILAGTNFSLFYLLARGRGRTIFQDREWRIYMGILAVVSLYIAATLFLRYEPYRSPGIALRHAVFQTVSIMTSTGFGTADFDLWPNPCRALLVAIMFIGGMTGSTAGGMKVIRVMILMKSAMASVGQTYSPRSVHALRIGDKALPETIRFQVTAFFCIWMTVTALGTLFMSGMMPPDQEPLVSAFTAVAATLNNVGPGLGMVGESRNYAFIAWPGKLFLTLCMALGRLELYAILVLFVPRFWRR